METTANISLASPESELRNGWDRPVGGGFAEAVRQGEILTQKIWSGKGMLTSLGAAKRLKVTPQTINRLRREGRLIGLTTKSTRLYHYPSWQFNKKIMLNVQQISESLTNYDDWGKYLFFVQTEPLLEGKAPLEWLRNGDAARVLHVAQLLNADAD